MNSGYLEETRRQWALPIVDIGWKRAIQLSMFEVNYWRKLRYFISISYWVHFSEYIDSVQFTQWCPTLRPHEPQHAKPPCPSPTPGFNQTHVHWVSDAIQPSHPLSSPSPPAFNLSQDQGLFQWVSSSHQVAKLLEFQLQHQSFQWTPRTDL